MSERPNERQWGGIAMITGGVGLTPVAAFTRDPAGGMAIGVAAILLLALGAALLPRAEGATPAWLHAVWLLALCLMAGLLG